MSVKRQHTHEHTSRQNPAQGENGEARCSRRGRPTNGERPFAMMYMYQNGAQSSGNKFWLAEPHTARTASAQHLLFP